MSNIESVAFEATNPRDRLFDAIIAANPDYERVLSKTTKLLQSGASVDTTMKEIPLDIFKNVTIGHKRSAATFDVVIGFPPNKMGRTSIGAGANELLKSKTISRALTTLAADGTTAGRVIEGKPSIRSLYGIRGGFEGVIIVRGFACYERVPRL